MKQIYRDLLFFSLLPLTFIALFFEQKLALTLFEHKLIQMLFIFVVYIIVMIWLKFDIKMKEIEMENSPKIRRINKKSGLRKLIHRHHRI